MTPRASASELGDLHGLAARYYREKLKAGDMTAADMNGLIRFLKDNSIDCIIGENPEMQSLIENLPLYDEGAGEGVAHVPQ